MNNEFDDLEARLRKADVEQPALDDSVLETATKSKKPNLPNHRAYKFGLTSVASVAALVVLVTALPQPGPTIQLASSNLVADTSAEDSSIAEGLPGWFSPYEYTASENLSESGSQGAVYELALEGDPRSKMRDFASLFGETGEIRLEEYSTDFFPNYSLETEDSYFSLGWHGSAIINYSSKRNWLADECYQRDEQETIESVPESQENCEPLPVAELPSEQELTDKAFELISAAGYPGTRENISVIRYQWGAEAYAATFIDNQETAIQWYVAWDQTAQISSVSGHLAIPEYVGDFDTVGASEAVGRIQDGYWFGVPAPSNYDRGVTNFDTPVSSEPIPDSLPDEMSGGESSASGSLPSEPMPEDFEMEAIQLTIESATEAILLIEDANGKGWLVPGYLLQTSEGWFESVVSLDQGVIQPPN